MDGSRFCVWCGAKVPHDSLRDLCKGHQHLAEVIDERVRRRMESDRLDTPHHVPVVRDRDGTDGP